MGHGGLLLRGLRMSGAITQLPLHAFRAGTLITVLVNISLLRWDTVNSI